MRKAGITADLVYQLIAGQFPQWAGLPIRPVEADGTWARGRGWAIWKAMIVLVEALKDNLEDATYTKGVIEAILADHLAAG